MGTSGGGSESTRIKSLSKAFRILEAIHDKNSVGVSDLASTLDIPKGTVHHYLSTLVQEGYAVHKDGEYQLGLSLLTLGGKARMHEPIYNLAKDDTDSLAEETGEIVRLITEHNGCGITLYQAIGSHAEEPFAPIGSREPLHCTAAGKAFLAEQSDEQVREILQDQEMTQFTEQTISDIETLIVELDAIRSQGVAFDDEERYEGIRCVATSVHTTSGEVLGAISVAGPPSRMADKYYRETIPDILRNAAGVVEINTTYSEWAGFE